MYMELDGSIKITDNESSSKIQLKKEDNDWHISGCFSDALNRSMLIFNIPVDQTVIQIIMTFFKNALSRYSF